MRAKLFLALIATIIAIALGEFAVRLVRLPPGYFPIVHQEDSLYVTDSVLGYTLKPGAHHQYVTPEVNVAMDVSSDGLRDTTLAAIRAADYRVLAVGNSFTMGLAVAADSTWSKQLERLLARRNPRAHVVNAGVAGFSPRQIRLRMEQLWPLVRPQLVIYGFTTETFPRMFRPNVLFGGTIVRSDVLPGLRVVPHGLLYSPYRQAWLRGIDYWLNQHLQLGAHVLRRVSAIIGALPRDTVDESNPQWIKRAMVPALDELSKAHEFARARRTPFLVLLLNPQLPDGRFSPLDTIYNGQAIARCRRDSIPYVDMLPILMRESGGRPIFRTVHDLHWSAAAHALAARALFDALPRR
jgi:lysophospholipase L1-like esterase